MLRGNELVPVVQRGNPGRRDLRSPRSEGHARNAPSDGRSHRGPVRCESQNDLSLGFPSSDSTEPMPRRSAPATWPRRPKRRRRCASSSPGRSFEKTVATPAPMNRRRGPRHREGIEKPCVEAGGGETRGHIEVTALCNSSSPSWPVGCIFRSTAEPPLTNPPGRAAQPVWPAESNAMRPSTIRTIRSADWATASLWVTTINVNA